MENPSLARRQFLSGTAAIAASAQTLLAAEDLPKLPTDFGTCPRTLPEFLHYIVPRRAAEGLNSIYLGQTIPNEKRKTYGTIYGGAVEDANVAWTAAAAYRYPWSRFHKHDLLRTRAFLLLDTLTHIRADGKWDDGGLDAYFGVHSLAWAVLSWLDTGAVDEPRANRWRAAVARAADDGLVCLHYGPYRPSALTGQYANPEMYFLSGLAAAWKLTGTPRYREEAANALRRYDEWLFSGGGMAYFLSSSPQHGYQQMIVKSVALYWDLTQDPLAMDFLKRLAPYFPNVQHPSGLLTDAEQPQLKHSFFNTVNPAVPAMLACALNDGANRTAAEVATVLMADNVDGRAPSFSKKGYPWYNYQAATFAASALRLLEKHPLPAPAPQPLRHVFMDPSFRGVRSHWDNFTAATTTRQMSDSLAGAYLADPSEPLMPLDAAIDGVYFEVRQGPKPTEFRCVDWTPTVTLAACDGFQSISCLSQLNAAYWGDMTDQISTWSTIQHWAVWRDCLIGFGALRSHAIGGEARDTARVRWRVSPQGRKLEVLRQTDAAMHFRYGGLQTELTCLEQKGGFRFTAEEITEAPRAGWTPLISRPAPWLSGDYLHVATVVRPSNSDGRVMVKAMKNGAAAVAIEPDGRKAFVWAVNLHRQLQQYLFDLPGGVTARAYKRDLVMPAIPPAEPASAGLVGGESAIWALSSESRIDPDPILASLRAGKGR